jgi:imidazolonepropionase-like amidohydrolase
VTRSTAITNVTLIDGTGTPPVERATIVIRDGRFESVGEAQAPEGADVVDASGLWAVPGLIDTHVHVELVGRESLALWLALGVTTVRDLGGALDFLVETRRQLNDGLVGARLLFSGPMIDGEPPTWPALNLATANAEESVAAVDEHLSAGADAIKLYTTLPLEGVKRCIERVDRRVPVTGHLAYVRASEAMEAGINGLEHALLTPYNDLAPEGEETGLETMTSPGYWAKVSAGWTNVDLDNERVERWIDLLVERDISFCPTLTVVPGAGDEPSEDELRLAPAVAERWLEATQQRQAVQAPPAWQELAKRARVKLQELVGRVHAAGGRVVSGTDTGAVRSLVPGFALHRELEFLSGAGLTNMDVLRAATGRAAEALWRDDVGVIAAARRADLLLLRRSPLEGIGALREIAFVYKDGVAYSPEELLVQTSNG